jgi:two-component system, OmpR family, sensor histidine kinase KdpD
VPVAQLSRPDDRRPDPDALLAAARRDAFGRLKVFVGAAPGVGKTYAMLQGARRLKDEAVDVVVGLVETHGRAETGALLEGLEVLPRRMVEYRGHTIGEFDVDAALARKPKLLVVDELAHTNAPDSRHPKRWQDVQELLDAGINVWTALNIQHLESLADVVSRISGVVVRETVPDRVLQEASDVVLVDITPDELIQRLNEGKVYVPETARRATQNFFTAGNLTALRELALRRTADRVDDQMVDYLRQKAIEGPWAASERLLACVGADEVSERVVRRAAQLATSLNAGWTAVTIEPVAQEADAAKANQIAKTFSLAERLGGDTMRLQGRDYPAEILRLARRENVTQIVIGQSRSGFWGRLIGRSLPEQIIRQAGPIEVHVVSSDEARTPVWRRFALKFSPKGLNAEILAALGSVACAVLAGEALTTELKLPNLSMIFLAAVLFSGVRFGTRAAVIASFASFAAYNFFFIEPVYTFTVAQPQELFALFIFLAVSVLTGSLTGRVRDQREGVIKNALIMGSLYDYSRKLSGASSADDVLWAAAAHLHGTTGGRIVLLAPEGDDFQIRAAWPPDAQLDAAAMTAARWAQQKNEPAGWGTGTLPSVGYQFRPLVAARGPIAVCGFEPRSPEQPITAEDERALTAILDQTAIALDRALLAREAVKAATIQENEKVRDALLASLSHDLRTPLSAIAGAATSLRSLGDKMSPAERLELLASIEEETARLSRFVANLLDMSRIEAGNLKVKRDLVDVADVVQGAAERSRKAFPKQPVRINLAPDLPFVRADDRLLEQVLFNLLDNAHKYAGDSGAIIHGRRDGDDVVLSVTDEGPGVKPADLERIFEKFYRGGRADGRRPGTGLGLSICRGLIEAMGGTIIAQSPAVRRRGTRIVIRLPAAEPIATEMRPAR